MATKKGDLSSSKRKLDDATLSDSPEASSNSSCSGIVYSDIVGERTAQSLLAGASIAIDTCNQIGGKGNALQVLQLLMNTGHSDSSQVGCEIQEDEELCNIITLGTTCAGPTSVNDVKLDDIGKPIGSTKPGCLLITRVYPVLAMAKMKNKTGEYQEVLISRGKLHSLTNEDIVAESNRNAAYRSDSLYLESVLKPVKIYSLNLLSHTTDFSSRSIQQEVISCLFHEPESVTQPILNRMPGLIKNEIISEFTQMQKVIQCAPIMAVSKKVQEVKKIVSFRFVTFARGVELDSDHKVMSNMEAEIVIYDETGILENVLYQFQNFTWDTVREAPQRKVKLTSTLDYIITPLKTFEDDYKGVGRVIDTLETLGKYSAGIPIHGEVDLVALLDSIEEVDPTSPNREYFVNVRSSSNQRKQIRIFGTPAENGLTDLGSSETILHIKNLKIIPRKLALIATACTQFQTVLRDEYDNLLKIAGAVTLPTPRLA